MKVTFLGGQSWLLESKTDAILVDPILGERFGSGPNPSFVIHPRRTIDNGLYSNVSTLVFSTEHFQHFDLQSVVRWKNSMAHRNPNTRPRIVISRMVSAAFHDFLKSLEVDVIALSSNEVFKCGEFEIVMAPCHPDVLIWDSRVVGVAIACSGASATEKPLPWTYFQSDTMIDSNFTGPTHWDHRPSLVVLTNHQRVGIESGYSPRDNFLLPGEVTNSAQETFLVGSSIVPKSKVKLGRARSYALVGGSYERSGLSTPSAQMSNSEMAAFLNCVSVGTEFLAPLPGDGFEIQSPGIERLPRSQMVHLGQWEDDTSRAAFELYPIFGYCEADTVNGLKDCSGILQHLNSVLAPKLLVTPFGEEMVFADFYLDKPATSRRFTLQMVDELKSHQFVFDLSLAKFVEEEFNGDRAMLSYPFGARVGLGDFQRLLAGELTVGEIVFAGFRQWCLPCSLERTPWAAFLTIYSESFSREISEARASFMKSTINKKLPVTIQREGDLNV